MLGTNFSNLFDLETQEIDSLVIKENNSEDNCFVYNRDTIIGGFILIKKKNVKTILNVSFYRSKENGKYLPRLEFRKVDNLGNTKKPIKEDIIIRFSTGEESRAFWKVIHFLQMFKELVDLGEFHNKYQAVSFDAFLVDFKSKQQAERVKELTSLTASINLSNTDIKELLLPQRRNSIHWFYAFIKNLHNKDEIYAFDSYKRKHNIKEQGEESVWHHFLKSNEWIIGLNVDLKFIRDLLSKQKVGQEDSKGIGSPEVDILGISYFTTLIELKTSGTKIFKDKKSTKSRANTWDFSEDFLEAYSQVLSQRSEISDLRDFRDENDNFIDTKMNRILDPKAILIIGNRNQEFPHIRNSVNDTKSDCFERIRRDSRNIEIVTYDELFERAFHIVYTEKLPKDWYLISHEEFKSDILKVK